MSTLCVPSLNPGKYRFGAIPKGLLLRKYLFDYGLSYQLEGRMLHVRRISLIQPARIKPAAYPDFLNRCRQIDDAEASPIPLRN